MIVRRFNPDRILAELGDATQLAIRRVLDSGVFIGGDEVAQFERECESHIECGAAISCASGTDAIELSLRALDLLPGSRVAAPAFTFAATGSAIVAAGLAPLFVDIDPATLQLCPTALEQALAGGDVSAVLAVSLYGLPLSDQIFEIASSARVPVIEDACQSFGSGCAGTRAGARALLTAFSFFPTKPLGCLGDGGLVTTSDMDRAARVRMLARHGFAHQKNRPLLPGRNSRLDALQAAVLRLKLPLVERWRQRRQDQASRYTEALRETVRPPPSADYHAWSLYAIRTPYRDSLMLWLQQAGIDAAVFYPTGLHRTVAFSAPVLLPNTDAATEQVLCLPISATVSDAEQAYVIDCVIEWAHRS